MDLSPRNFDVTWKSLVWLGLSALLVSACDCGSNNSTPGTTGDGGMDGNVVATGLPIGSACTAADQCGGVTNPACLAGLYPLDGVPGIPPGSGLTFTGGYCSAVPTCSTDAECDPAHGGQCFRPFRNATANDWTALETSLELAPGTLSNAVGSYGVCLKTCTAEADCRDPGYACEAPLASLLDLLPTISAGFPVVNTQTFCVQPVGCVGFDCGAGICDVQDDGVTPTCICPADTTFDGTTCVPVCTPGCGANATCTVATGGAHVCTCDAGFESDGTACIVPACQGECGANASFTKVDGLGSLRCTCDDGFVGDGTTCSALACAPTCDGNAACVAASDATASSCVCNTGLLGDGTTCTTPGTTRYVDNAATNAADSGDCASSTTPCLTINYAVAQASGGDVIQVSAGAYPEMVSVDRSLTFLGANAGVNAGVGAGTRGAESTVIGFRSPEGGGAHPTSAYSFSVTIDGFAMAPQGNAQVLGWSTYDMVSLYGGPMVRVVNNVFDGGTWNPACDFADDPTDSNPRVMLCKDMADSALMIQSGAFEIAGNRFSNFRRPVDIAVWGATATDPAVPPNGVIAGNSFDHIYWRAIWLLDRFGGTVTIVGNDFDATGTDAFNVGSAAIIITSGGNVVRGNTFTGWSSAVFAQVCDGSNTASYAANTYVNNRFTGNRSGIQYYQVGTDTACQVAATIHGNDFVGSTRYAVRWNGDFTTSNPPATLDATSNWFGDAAGAEVVPYVYDMTMDTSATRENVTPYVTIASPYTVSGGCTN